MNLKGSDNASMKLIYKLSTILSTCCYQAERLVGSGNESRAKALNWAKKSFSTALYRYLVEDWRVAVA